MAEEIIIYIETGGLGYCHRDTLALIEVHQALAELARQWMAELNVRFHPNRRYGGRQQLQPDSTQSGGSRPARGFWDTGFEPLQTCQPKRRYAPAAMARAARYPNVNAGPKVIPGPG